jgi:hypothetical protein
MRLINFLFFLLVGCNSSYYKLLNGKLKKTSEVDEQRPTPENEIPKLRTSLLYPANWNELKQDIDGDYLQNYSYAGFKNSEELLDLSKFAQISVLDFGADRKAKRSSSDAFKKAIKRAATLGGGVIFVPNGDYLLTSSLQISSSNIFLLGESRDQVTLYFEQEDTQKYSIEFKPSNYRKTFIKELDENINVFNRQLEGDFDDLAIGDDFLLGIEITDKFRADHKMSGLWNFSGNTWRAFFRRSVQTKDQQRIGFKVPIRYQLKIRDRLALYKEIGLLENCGILNLSFNNIKTQVNSNRHHFLKFINAKDCVIQNIQSVSDDSGFDILSNGILIEESKKITIDQVDLKNSKNRGVGGNGYLFEISKSNEILIANSKGVNGRHNFILNWDFGTSGCVFHKIFSSGSWAVNEEIEVAASSEFHHSLAMANLVEQSKLDDGWISWNRRTESSGAGHAGTQNVFWNNMGTGNIVSYQFGRGYVIGTTKDLKVSIDPSKNFIHQILQRGLDTRPYDYTEYLGQAEKLWPKSLFLDQLEERLK